jgi:carboxypeptidase T
MRRLSLTLALCSFIFFALSQQALAVPTGKAANVYWMKIKASDKFERSALADSGLSLEIFSDDYVIALGSLKQRELLQKQGLLLSSYVFQPAMWDFPMEDANFHNYDRMQKVLQDLNQRYPDITVLDSIGKSVEGRELFRLRISKNVHSADVSTKPGIVFMGGHHAREHLSVEIPLLLAQYLVEEYAKGTPDVVRMVDSRDIHIIPMVNPDGAEFDTTDSDYHLWRKNRSKNGDGTFGVDLNRNYGFQWGTGGSSLDTSDETYMGPKAFSEPETQAIKSFLDQQSNISMLLSFHSFSELILYPWGHNFSPIPDVRDHSVFDKMAQTMSKWNGYKAQQASALYRASGDTTDWAYGTHKIFAFTFELDPKSDPFGSAEGFYPGQAAIPTVFKKNLQPCLYMMDLADNPYRSLMPNNNLYGLNSLSLE